MELECENERETIIIVANSKITFFNLGTYSLKNLSFLVKKLSDSRLQSQFSASGISVRQGGEDDVRLAFISLGLEYKGWDVMLQLYSKDVTRIGSLELKEETG